MPRFENCLKSIFQDRGLTGLMWAAWGVSSALLIWQLVAFLTGNVPDHIMPLVLLISGSQESVPVAYSWTFIVGLLSVAGFIASCIFFGLKALWHLARGSSSDALKSSP